MPGVPVILFHPQCLSQKAVAALAVSGWPSAAPDDFFVFCGLRDGKPGGQTFSNLSGRIMVTQKGSVFGGLFQGVGSSSIPDSYIGLIDDVPHVTNVTGQVTAILRPVGSALVMPLFGYGEKKRGYTFSQDCRRGCACRRRRSGDRQEPPGVPGVYECFL